MKKQVGSPASDFHLCQPDSQKSCCWCCGLYNVAVASKEALVGRLRARTERFAETERTVDGIEDFSLKIIRAEKSQLLDTAFYSCEFVGFLDSAETLVGCMLHPLASGNESVDYRGLSFHGTMACQGYFCRSYRHLSGAEQKVVLGTIQDWYLYGLVISDAAYVKSFFGLLQERLGRQIDAAKLLEPPAADLVDEFFHWKVDWPHGGNESETASFQASTFSRANQANNTQEFPVFMDVIFDCLDSRFKSEAEYRSAKQKVHQLFSRLSKLL